MLARINATRTTKGLANLVARMHNSGPNVLFSFGSSPDYDNSSQVIAHALQGGLGLPDRDYYLEHDDATPRRVGWHDRNVLDGHRGLLRLLG